MNKFVSSLLLCLGVSADSYFLHKTVIIPHDDKKSRAGEDAAQATSDLLVVADGVGGWANSGINPGLYSRDFV